MLINTGRQEVNFFKQTTSTRLSFGMHTKCSSVVLNECYYSHLPTDTRNTCPWWRVLSAGRVGKVTCSALCGVTAAAFPLLSLVQSAIAYGKLLLLLLLHFKHFCRWLYTDVKSDLFWPFFRDTVLCPLLVDIVRSYTSCRSAYRIKQGLPQFCTSGACIYFCIYLYKLHSSYTSVKFLVCWEVTFVWSHLLHC